MKELQKSHSPPPEREREVGILIRLCQGYAQGLGGMFKNTVGGIEVEVKFEGITLKGGFYYAVFNLSYISVDGEDESDNIYEAVLVYLKQQLPPKSLKFSIIV